jgi:hypothetical protein
MQPFTWPSVQIQNGNSCYSAGLHFFSWQKATDFYSSTQSEASVMDFGIIGGFPVSTAWRVLGFRMEERPPAMEGSCEYIE